MKQNSGDLILLLSIIIISLFGLLMIYSSSAIWAEYKFDDPFKYFKAQGLFLITGYILMYIVSKIYYKNYLDKANIILLICFVLLILVLIPGIGTIRNGSRSWFGVGGFGIQPSEFAKLGLIIFTAKYLTKNEKLIKNIKKGVFPILGITLLFFGLIMLQPDFGTGVILVMSIIGLLYIAGIKFSFFTKLAIVGLVGMVGLIIAAPYRLQRIITFINPWADPLGSGFQTIQSLFAIGPGGLLGLGLGNSIQKHFYLPEPQTDFIFSIIAEELGFLGALTIGCLFILIIIRGYSIAMNTTDVFAKYLAFGITFQVTFQAALNLMVVVGLVPVTGITLPFISYGGSSLLITLIAMGILLNISKYQENRLK
ncbi:MAG: putative lipid II flippase FtsW [Bacilli bacterium]|nr:putative lipid II flippase FtsW [Bacilli bacterium]